MKYKMVKLKVIDNYRIYCPENNTYLSFSGDSWFSADNLSIDEICEIEINLLTEDYTQNAIEVIKGLWIDAVLSKISFG